MSEIPSVISQTSKPAALSVVHFVAAVLIYRYLITGGWLTNSYHLDDPNIVNLALALYEPIAVLTVLAYWVWRKDWLYRVMSILCVIQVLIGAGFLLFILLFALFWHPKLM